MPEPSATVGGHLQPVGRLMTSFAEIKTPLILGTLVFLVIVVGYRVADFSPLFGDARAYVTWSYDVTTHSSYESHVPGYPAMIYLLRTVTFGWLSDVILAQAICYVFWVTSLLLVKDVLAIWAPELKDLGVLCIALAPLVGVSLAAYPVTECIARAFLFAALLAAIHRRWTAFAMIVAAGLFIHQAYYPIYLFLALTLVLTKGMRWFYLLASGIPFVAYYVRVALVRGDPLWIVAGHSPYGMRLADVKTYPIFDGILQTLIEANPISLARGILLVTVTALAIGLLIYSLKWKHWCLVAITAPIVLFAVFASRNIAFIVIRLSPLLVLPLSVMLVTRPGVTAFLKRRSVYASLAIMLALSQLCWALYDASTVPAP